MTDSVTNNEELDLEDEVVDEADDVDAASGVDDAGDTSVGQDAELDEIEAELSAELGLEEEDEIVEEAADAPAEAGEDDEMATLRGEYNTLNDRHLRLAAEFNNFRRRTEREQLGAWARAQADLVAKFLDVLDDLHRVAELDLENATVEAIMEGIDLVERKFVRTLADSNVTVLDPVGEPFDPELMEAMMRVPVETDEQMDTVAQVFQKGYTLQGVLVRPARVSVYTSS